MPDFWHWAQEKVDERFSWKEEKEKKGFLMFIRAWIVAKGILIFF